jgi:hypothetical protein
VQFPADVTDHVLSFAARRAVQNPELVFRNPQILETACKKQRDDRAEFMEFFGTDLVVLPGTECREQLLAFRRQHANGYTGDHWEDLGLPDDEPVAMLYDEAEGLGFFAGYPLLLDGFAHRQEVDRDLHAELVLSFLTDDSIGTGPLRRAAELFPDTVDEVYAHALGRSGFSWVRDGEDLLREFKPWASRQLPRIVPLTPRLAAHVKKHGMD